MAGAGRRTFTPGEVLTASNVMNYLQDQAVMNFAGTAARGSAIGTAVSEGMVSYLADSNVVQAYDGSAWNSLAYASAVPTVAQVGLVPVIAPTVNYSGGTATANTLGTISFSAVSSISLNSIFTSTYQDYKIVFELTTVTTDSTEVRMRFRASGSDNSASSYGQTWTVSRANSGTVGTNNGWGNAQGGITRWWSTSNSFTSFVADVLSPQIAKASKFLFSASGWDSTSQFSNYGMLVHESTTQFDGITFYSTAGAMTGTVSVYGYTK